MEDKDIFKILENEIIAANTVSAAKKAYDEKLESYLEHEVQASNAIKTAKLAYEANIEKCLENEISARNTINKAKEAYQIKENEVPAAATLVPEAALSGKEKVRACEVTYEAQETGHSDSGALTGKTASISWNRYIISAAAACFLGFVVFRTDNYYTNVAGKNMYLAYCDAQLTQRDGDLIDKLIEKEEYKQALKSINEGLEANKIMTASAEDEDAKQFCKDQYNHLMEQKAIVLLLMGEHRQAKTILKELDTPYAKKALEDLLW